MEKNIVEYFERKLNVNNGRLSMLSLSGHLAELSQKERKHIKKIGGLEKLFIKYPESFLIDEDDVHVLQREDKKEDVVSKSAGGKEEAKEGIPNALQDKKSTVNLESAKDDPCTVCSDPIEIYAIGECRHPICFRCSIKLRVLCEDKNCPVCRQTLDLVVFSEKLLPIDEHEIDKYIRDKKYGIAFENIKICEQKSAVLRHICPKCPNQIFENFTSLEAHVHVAHQLYYCSICVRQCKIFTEERKTYTYSELKKHIEYGDDTGSTIGGHPLCEFCAYRYLDNDELLRHLRLHHCSCRICDQVNEEQKNYQFYADKNFLLVHQRQKHFPCEHPDCLELDQIPAFKDEIDLQSHNLQHHSREKSKLEKRAEQRINVPFMYERRVKAKRILKAEKDAVGGINITGCVARHVEKMYSFIERDDASSNFEENVFFDLEACGLQIYDDVREHFKSGDRVSAYALPCAHPSAKSKWKAQKVEKIDDFSDDEPEYQPNYYEDAESIPPLEIHTNEFPSLAANSASTQPVPALAGWSKLAQSRPPAFKPVGKPVFPPKPKQKKPSYEIGYIHRNLSEKFGFIQAEKFGFSFEDNVYFNLEAFLLGSPQSVGDLRSVFNPGDKVCYILDDGPLYSNSKAKYRAQLVWKYSHNAENIPSIDPDGFRLVTGKPNAKFKTPALEKKPLVVPDKFVALAEMYKKKLQSETKNINQPQESNLPGNSLIDSNFVAIEDVLSPLKMEPVKSRTNSKSSVDIADSKGVPQPSFKGDGETILSLVKQPVSETNSNYSNSINGVLQHSQLARVFNTLTVSDDEIKAANSQTTDSDLYSSTDDEDSEDGENDDDSDENMINDPHHKLFIDVLAICINNKAIYKILRQQISVEMEKQGVKDPTKLQFLELRKEDNSAHILFHIPKCDEGGTGYAKLTGFYPLDSSWSSELKTKRMATRITKEYYRINGSCHYIMVARSKPSKVTLHYRPLCSAST